MSERRAFFFFLYIYYHLAGDARARASVTSCGSFLYFKCLKMFAEICCCRRTIRQDEFFFFFRYIPSLSLLYRSRRNNINTRKPMCLVSLSLFFLVCFRYLSSVHETTEGRSHSLSLSLPPNFLSFFVCVCLFVSGGKKPKEWSYVVQKHARE